MPEVSCDAKRIKEKYDKGCEHTKAALKELFPTVVSDDKSIDFSKAFNHSTRFLKSTSACEEIMKAFIAAGGSGDRTIQIRSGESGLYDKKSFCLSNEFNWKIEKDGSNTVLVPTRK